MPSAYIALHHATLHHITLRHNPLRPLPAVLLLLGVETLTRRRSRGDDRGTSPITMLARSPTAVALPESLLALNEAIVAQVRPWALGRVSLRRPGL